MTMTTRITPFAALSIGQLFIMHGTVHVKKSSTTALNCLNMGRVTVTPQTNVKVA